MIRTMGVLFLLPAAFGQPAQRCEEMKRFELAGVRVEMTRAERVAAPVAHCRVEGVVDRRVGVAGKEYGIRFALALPVEWNQRFLMQGGGGLNGSVAQPLGPVGTGGAPALGRGFAVVTTDTGHQGAVFDASFMADQQAALDFAYVAIGRVSELAKKMIAHYYGEWPAKSYYTGCSTGGREGMLMTQRYPQAFDGVIVGAPAMRTGYSNLADRYVAVMLNQVAPKDEKGLPATARALSEGQKKTFMAGLLAACDLKDGAADGMIWNVRGCDFDPARLVCTGEPNDGCLTAAQAAAIKQGFAGPKTARGEAVYAGFAYDTGITASGQGAIPGLLNPGRSPVGPPATEMEMDVDAAAARVRRDEMQLLTDSTWVNLSTFAGRGGKVMYFHGVSDPWFSALDTVGYYERMTAANGGREKVEAFGRLYLAPGMGHCGGGPALDSFDMLTALVGWVEKGTAPESVVATGRAFAGRSRPMCAYPKYAHYKGSGDVEKAENWECRE